MKHFKKILIVLLLSLLGSGGFYMVKAAFPDVFWRVVQIGDQLQFLYGNLTTPQKRVVFTSQGQLGVLPVSESPHGSAILELGSSDKGLLVTRVAQSGTIVTPVNGMIVYVENDDCFKVYQSGAWSSCFNVAESVISFDTATAPADNEGSGGDIYYNTDEETVFVHTGNEWIPLVQGAINVGLILPANEEGRDKELFYDRDNTTLYIHQGGVWVPLEIDFSDYLSYQKNCERVSITGRDRELTCPNHKFIASVYYENALWDPNQADNHATPEITAVDCCELSYAPYAWEVTDWEPCSETCGENGTQSRTVRCVDVQGQGAPTQDACKNNAPKPSSERVCNRVAC